MQFIDRSDAGKKLAEKIVNYKSNNPIVLAIPRGGVVVGYEIAKRLKVPMDVIIVRKLGAPHNPELGIGAIGEENVKILDHDLISQLKIEEPEIEHIYKQETEELTRRVKLYREGRKLTNLKDKVIILADDGLATGMSMQAAIQTLLKQDPQKLIIAIPVCAGDSRQEINKLLRENDQIVCLTVPNTLSSIGEFYEYFPQLTDNEVLNYLKNR